MPNAVTPTMPAKTARPSARRISAPAPTAIISGTTPRMNANEVIRIGRRRSLTACSVASRREAGANRYDATLEACKLRLRPIVMTSFAFILGVVPLVISVGAGAEMRRTLGTAVFSGMLGVTLFGIFLTPVFYYVIQWVKDVRGQNQEATNEE